MKSAFFLILIFLLSYNFGESQDNKISHNPKLKIIEGFYLNTNYLKVLNDSKSPMAADDSCVVSFIRLTKVRNVPNHSKERLLFDNGSFEKYKEGFTYYGLYGFHESFGGLVSKTELKADGFYDLLLKDMTYHKVPDQIKFVVTPTDTLLIYREKNIQDTLVLFNRDLEEYVNGIIVEGRYLLNDRTIIIFNNNGSGKWGKKPFRYNIGLDSFFQDSDILSVQIEGDSTKDYSFDREESRLLLYDTYEPSPVRVSRLGERPKFILNKIQK